VLKRLSHIINSRKPERIISVSVYVFGVDFALKMLALTGVHAGWTKVAEFGLFLNPGFAFSLGRPGLLFWGLLIGAFAAAGYTLWHEVRAGNRLAAAWLVMALVGGFSNLFDRVRLGATVDYLIFFDWSAVNLADGLIVAGFVGWMVAGARQATARRPARSGTTGLSA
jgi:lipoprotein signal peptidase